MDNWTLLFIACGIAGLVMIIGDASVARDKRRMREEIRKRRMEWMMSDEGREYMRRLSNTLKKHQERNKK